MTAERPPCWPDDLALVQAVLDRNKAAFDELYERLKGIFWRAAAKYYHGKQHDAEDAFQQIWIHFLDILPRYRNSGSSLAAWARTIGVNKAIDLWRKRQREPPAKSMDKLSEAGQEPIRKAANEATGLPDEESLQEAIQQCVEGFTNPAQKQAVRCWLDGMKYRDICSVLNRRHGTAASLIARGVAKIREHLLERFPEVAQWNLPQGRSSILAAASDSPPRATGRK